MVPDLRQLEGEKKTLLIEMELISPKFWLGEPPPVATRVDALLFDSSAMQTNVHYHNAARC